jgi:NAD(P)-dependent dehydrogenase (short-subunit alcohol dehydrogenase family)
VDDVGGRNGALLGREGRGARADRNAAVEAAPYGVRVNSVAPGATPNPYLDRVVDPSYYKAFAEQTPLALATPPAVARAILFLASDASDRISGECVNVSGGFYLRP